MARVKNHPGSGRANANPLPRTVGAAPNRSTRRVRFTIEQTLGTQDGLLSGVNLGDQVQEQNAATRNEGGHRRQCGLSHGGLNRGRGQSGMLQEEGRAENPQSAAVIRSTGRCRRGPRLGQGRHHPRGAGTRRGQRGILDELLSGRQCDANDRRRVAHHLHRLRYYYHKREAARAAVEVLQGALRDEINKSHERAHGHQGPAHQDHREHNHQPRGNLSANGGASVANQNTGTTSEQPRNCPPLRLRQLIAIRLAYIYRRHCQHGNQSGHVSRLPGLLVPIPLASSTPLSDWPTFENMSFVRSNYIGNRSGLINDARRGALLVRSQLAGMPGNHRRPMDGHRQKSLH